MVSLLQTKNVPYFKICRILDDSTFFLLSELQDKKADFALSSGKFSLFKVLLARGNYKRVQYLSSSRNLVRKWHETQTWIANTGSALADCY